MRYISFFVIAAAIFLTILWPSKYQLSWNHVTGLAMVLLLGIINELKDFNFLGIRGTRRDPEIQHINEGDPINEDSLVSPSSQQLKQAESQRIQLMGDEVGNFLVYAFEIEKLLKIAESINIESSQSKSLANLKELKKIGFLTEDGNTQVTLIRKFRNLYVHGRAQEIAYEDLKIVLRVAENFYNEIFDWWQKNYRD